MNHIKPILNPDSTQLILPPDDAALQERIAKRAYYIWLANGSRHGEHLRYWLEAEREELKAIRQDQQQSTARQTKRTRRPRSAIHSVINNAA